MLKMLDLFSGIGGFSLAASWTGGIETVAFCEIEPYCQKVLHKHWPDVPIYPDIKQLRGEDIGSVDIVCGGFPCQPFSCAGKQRGKEDDRYLWPEMFRVIQETKPTWVIGENVANFVNMGLDDCFSDLEGQGYEVQPLIIPACGVNAPHRRDRVWIIAHSRGTGCDFTNEGQGRSQRKALPAANPFSQFGSIASGQPNTAAGQTARVGVVEQCRAEGNVADTESQRCGEAGADIQRPETRITSSGIISNPDRQGLPSGGCCQQTGRGILGGYGDVTNSQCRGLQSGIQQRTWSEAKFFAEDGRNTRRNYTRGMWDAEPGMGRLAYGIPRAVVRDKLKALGNSIVPQVAYPIFQGIVDIERQLREG